ncbi:MAG: RHS repeat domain-containing protein, partial [Marinicella sp.]
MKTNYIYDVTTGQVTQSKDPNNIKTNMVYDVFGVLTSQNVQDNSGDYLESTQTSHMQNCAVVGCTSADSIIATAMANIQTITNTESPFGYQMSAYEGFYFNNNFIHKPVLAFKTESHQPGTPKTTQWLDQNGQVVLTESEHSGGTSYVLTLTNPLGQTELITQPFVLNTTPYFNLDDYDDYGRMSERMVRVGDLVGNGDANCWRDTLYTPVQGKTEVTAKYDGAGCETTLNSSLTMYRSYDSQGKLRHTKDATDKTTKYWYDSMGNPYIIADAVYNEIVTQFDDLGRKKSVDDPNMGIKYFSYNSFGEVIFEQDAEQLGQVGDGNYTIYDPLGRLATKYWNVDAAYLPLSDVRSYRDNFTYSNSCGSLTSVCNEFRDSNFQEPTSFSAAQHKSYLYDEFGRVINQDIELIDVFGGLSDLAYVGEFSIDYHYYENYNFLKQTVYNRAYIRDDGDSFYSVVNHYDLYGSLLKQTKSDPDPIDLMENISFNHRGQVEVKHLNSSAVSQYFYHDGTGQVKRIDHSTGSGEYQIFNYEYDAWGNITEQNNGILGQTTETFVYDELQRLKSSSVVGNGHSNTITYDYDIAGLGNLVRKSDYSNTQAYDQERNAGPNAITSAVLINGDGTIDYSYDLKGNRILDVLGTFESHYVYDANNLLIHARDQVGENVESEIDFRYGVDQQRYLKYEDSFDPTSPIRSKEATVYAGPYFEEVIDLVFLTKELKLQVSDYLTLTVKNNNRIEHHFMQKDRLGSTTQILDENNIVVKTMSYDAFGKPRNGDTWNIYDMSHPQLDFSSDGSIDITKRGFTDHEHLDNFELIHMNGRMYDFNNGRFLSVDPFIHGVTSQGINPYSYILNNPLAGTDPTGYVPLMIEEAQITGLIPTENSSVEEQKAFMRSEAVTGELVIVAAIAIDGFSDYINPLKGIAKKGIKETFKTVSEGFKKAFTNGKDKIVSTKDTNRAISSKKTQTSTT